MKATVIIPTTTRPVLVSGLQERPNIKASMVVAEGDFRGLPISDDYDRLIGVSGPLSAVVGRPGLPPHMLRLSHAFESGRSWEVPVCLAHFLSSRGVTLVRDPAEADLVCWATGAVDSDLSVVPDRYFLDQKLNASIEMLRNIPAKALTIVLLPKGNDDDKIAAPTHAALRELDASITQVSSIDDATAAIQKLVGSLGSAAAAHAPRSSTPEAVASKQPTRTGDRKGDETAPQPGPRGRGWKVAAAVLLLATAGLAWGAARIVIGPSWNVAEKGGPAGIDKKDIKSATTAAGSNGNVTTAQDLTGHKQEAKGPDLSTTKTDATGRSSPGDVATDAKGNATGPSETPTANGKAGDSISPPTTPSGTATPPAGTGSASPSPPPGNPTAATEPSSPAIETGKTDPTPAGSETRVDPTVEAKAAKGEDTAATGTDGLLHVEEWRAPAGGSCQDLLYQSQQPGISVLKPDNGRVQASSVQGLCALVFRTTESGRNYALVVDRRLTAMTMDAPPGVTRGERRGNEFVRFFRGRDSGQGLTYDIVLRPLNPSANTGEVRFTHELRR